MPRYRQLAGFISNAIHNDLLKAGDQLPSVNEIIQDTGFSRDTVVKAYMLLKKSSLIESVPQKGYYVKGERSRVMLMLDNFSAFKEGLYKAFRSSLPAEFEIDVVFHHYNIEVFRSLLLNSQGRYSYHVIMSFDHPGTREVFEQLNPTGALVIDLVYHIPENFSFLAQDFVESLYHCLLESKEKILRYKEFHFILPPDSHHPPESIQGFTRFCNNAGMKGEVRNLLEYTDVRKNQVYLVISDNDMVTILERCRESGWTPGNEVGIISYNDSPVKKVIGTGITTISIDFEDLGRRAALVVKSGQTFREEIPARLISRGSL